jgi:hypothetical protein
MLLPDPPVIAGLVNSPADVVAMLLEKSGAASDPGTTGAWPVTVGLEADTPDDCLTVYDTLGRLGKRDMVMGDRSKLPGVQVKVRSMQAEVGQAKCWALCVLFDNFFQEEVTINGALYRIQNITRTGDPLALGEEPESKRSLFTLNAVVSLRQLS